MKRRAIGFGIATLALALAARAAAASRAPVPVASHVRIETASLTLADLLPATAPHGLRSRAARISLGAAPLPGSRRRLSRSEIEDMLGERLAGELWIPSSIVVERASRELTRREVFLAIRAALARNGFAHAAALSAADVQFDMPVRVTAKSAGLRVLGMHLDPALHLAVFRLSTTEEASVPPFDVLMRPASGLAQWLARVTGETKQAGGRAGFVQTRGGMTPEPAAAWRVRKPRPKPLVLPWQTASLLLISGTMEIHTTAEPLERGYLGQVIRVRMKKTRQVFRAEVVAPGCLEARF